MSLPKIANPAGGRDMKFNGEDVAAAVLISILRNLALVGFVLTHIRYEYTELCHEYTY